MKDEKRRSKTQAVDKKRGTKRVSIAVETKMTVTLEKADFHLEKRRAAIKAALTAATAGLAATTSGIAGRVADTPDGGTPPWGEVIIEPIWQERNPPQRGGDVLIEAAEISFWE